MFRALLATALRFHALIHALKGDRATGDDAVVETRNELAEEQTAGTERTVGQPLAVTRGQPIVRAGECGVVAHHGLDKTLKIGRAHV